VLVRVKRPLLLKAENLREREKAIYDGIMVSKRINSSLMRSNMILSTFWINSYGQNGCVGEGIMVASSNHELACDDSDNREGPLWRLPGMFLKTARDRTVAWSTFHVSAALVRGRINSTLFSDWLNE
jgi:hypothetical protein